VENDRIIGGINKKSAQMAAILYSHFVNGEIYLTDTKTAEIVKLIENSSRDVQIAFAHQIASMAKTANLDPYEIIELANKHPRVNILKPTCGVGGHCIAIDPWFLVESFPKDATFIETARQINIKRPQEVLNTIKIEIEKWQKQNNKTCNILVLGLTYKPDVDDLRESPALLIAKHLCNTKNTKIMIAEPHIKQEKLFDLFPSQATSVSEGLQKADVIVYLVAHKRFKAIDKKLLANKIILDFCGITYKSKKPINLKSDIKEWKTSGMLDFFIANKNKRYEPGNHES
jgi:UDP-N-acetyl-D-mannosaminuronic acid dehydrogenase